MNENEEKLHRILNNLLWFTVKFDDAPMSAVTYLDHAISDLSYICPNWKTGNKELLAIVDNAKEHMALLGYVPHT